MHRIWLVLLVASQAMAAEELQLRCVAEEVNRFYAEKGTMVVETPLNKDGKKQFWYRLKKKGAFLETQGLLPFDDDFGLQIEFETGAIETTQATFRLVTTKAGKVTGVLGEDRDTSRIDQGNSEQVRNLDLVNLQIADGLPANEPFDVARVLRYIKDGKFPDGSPLAVLIDCQPIKVTIPD